MNKNVSADEYRALRDNPLFGPDHPLTQQAFQARLNTVLAEEQNDPAEDTVWWLSFVDPDRAAPRGQQQPGGPGFLGVAIIHAPGPIHAQQRAHELGINPGGEVAAYPVPARVIPHGYRDRLLTRDDIAALKASS